MDAQAVEQLRLHARFARRLARGLLRDEHLADDAVQETWLAALRRPPRVLSRAWIAAVVRNAAASLRRSEARRATREAAVAGTEELPGVWEPERQAVLREVVDAILALDEPHRSTLLLRFYDGLPPREIAELHGVPVNTVNSRLQRGLAEVRKRLGAEERERRLALVALASPRRARLPSPRELVSGAVRDGGLAMGIGMKLGAAAIVAVALGLAWVLTGRHEPAATGQADSAPAVAEAERGTSATRSTAPRARAASEQGGAASATPRSATDAAAEATVPDAAGRVFAPEGAPTAGGFAYVAGGADETRRLLARVPLDAEGRFEFVLPADAPRDVEVGASVPGLQRNARKVVLRRGETQHVDIHLAIGLRIAGTVVDPEGRPLPRLRLLARPASTARRFVTDADLDTDALLAVRFDASSQWARGTTDDMGRFALEGLAAGRYALLSEESAWFVDAGGLVAAGTEDLRVAARPAQSAVARVVDGRTGVPLDFQVSVVFRRRGPRENSSNGAEIGVRRGQLRISWDRDRLDSIFPPASPGETPLEFGMAVRVFAEGYERREVPLSLETREPQSVEIRLDPVLESSLAKVRLEVVDARGAPVDDALRVWLGDGKAVDRQPATSRLAKDAPGRFTLLVTPGRWSMYVVPADAWNTCFAKSQQVEVFAGSASDLRVELPAWGHVVARRKAREGAYPSLRVAIGDAAKTTWGMRMGERELRRGLPPGTWRFLVGDREAATSREIVVRAFEDTIVELDE